MKMMKNGGINSYASEIQKQLLLAETISKEIQEAVNEKEREREYSHIDKWKDPEKVHTFPKRCQ